jgi:hypothetical protein
MEEKKVNVEKISDDVVYKVCKIDAMKSVRKLLIDVDEIEKRVLEKLEMLGFENNRFDRSQIIDFICSEIGLNEMAKQEIEFELSE